MVVKYLCRQRYHRHSLGRHYFPNAEASTYIFFYGIAPRRVTLPDELGYLSCRPPGYHFGYALHMHFGYFKRTATPQFRQHSRLKFL